MPLIPIRKPILDAKFFDELLKNKACKMRDKIIKKYEDVDDWWKKENQQLREILYKCREKLDWLNGGYDVWGGELTDFIEEIDNAIGEKE